MKSLFESLMDVDDLSKNLDDSIKYYDNAIKLIKKGQIGLHPNTLTYPMMCWGSKPTDVQIMSVLRDINEEDSFDLHKVLVEISDDTDWYNTFNTVFWINGTYEEKVYPICTPQTIYKKMTDQQYDLLINLGMWEISDYKNIEEWILIRDKAFDNQHWVIYIKKDMKAIHKRVMRELIKYYEKRLKVKK